MPAEDKRNRLKFQKRAAADDALGNKEGDWVDQFDLNARVMPLRGSETVIASRLAGVQPVIITVWDSYLSRQVTNGWRAIDPVRNVTYNIRTNADMTEKATELQMMADSGVAT